MQGSGLRVCHSLSHGIVTIDKVGTLLNLPLQMGKLKLGEIVQGFHGRAVAELHLPCTKAHILNHCIMLGCLSHGMGAKRYVDGSVSLEWGQTCRASNVELRSLNLVPKIQNGAMGSYRGSLRRVVTWSVLRTWSILKMDRHLVAIPWGLCPRLASSPQPRQPFSLAHDPSLRCCSEPFPAALAAPWWGQ